jgi:imidazolonepropionase-like amidohydrolase
VNISRAIIENATVIDGVGGRREHCSLAIEGTALSAVAEQVPRRPGDIVFDASGLFVTPGFCDAHCHLMYDNVSGPISIELTQSVSEATVGAVANAAKVLGKGFTCVRDVGSRDRIGVAVRNAINAALIPGPRVFCSLATSSRTVPTGTDWAS